MIKKEQCLSGTRVIVNSKVTPLCKLLGSEHLLGFPYHPDGYKIGSGEIELKPGAELEIIAPPKKIGESGNQIKFKVLGSNMVFAAWWSAFKPKVDIKKV